MGSEVVGGVSIGLNVQTSVAGFALVEVRKLKLFCTLFTPS